MNCEKVEIKREKIRALLSMILRVQNINVQAELIQSLTPLALLYAQRMIKEEVYKIEGIEDVQIITYGENKEALYIKESASLIPMAFGLSASTWDRECKSMLRVS
jgi:hypothetical protein